MIGFELVRWIATGAMLADHVGVCVAPAPTLRLIGRLAFPMFAWMIATNAARSPGTRSRMMRRLALWSILSQPAYMIFGSSGLNIFPTFLAGVALAPWLTSRPALATAAIAACIASGVAGVSPMYGTAGVLAVALGASGSRAGLACWCGVANLGGGAVPALAAMLGATLSPLIARVPARINRVPLLGYVFYPAHLLILAPFR